MDQPEDHSDDHGRTEPTDSMSQEDPASVEEAPGDEDDEDDNQKSQGKKGVIYLSYIPPGMDVKKVRDIFERFGQIGRVYLEPTRAKQRNGHQYVEGWIEFNKKRVAKLVAKTLNGTPVGGKRRTLFHDSIWNIKYLHRFKWHNLTEQQNYEKALRDERLRFEVSRVKKEAQFYEEQVDELKRRKRKNIEPSQDVLESRSSLFQKRQKINRRTDP